MGLGSARQYVTLRRLLASGGLAPEQRARVQVEMEEIRDGMLTHEEVPGVKTRVDWKTLCTLVLSVMVVVALVWAVVFYASMRVPTEGEVVVGAVLHHYDPWRSKTYMAMEVTAVHPDGTVELDGTGFFGWMAGHETVPMSELTDGHRRMLYTEWVIEVERLRKPRLR